MRIYCQVFIPVFIFGLVGFLGCESSFMSKRTDSEATGTPPMEFPRTAPEDLVSEKGWFVPIAAKLEQKQTTKSKLNTSDGNEVGVFVDILVCLEEFRFTFGSEADMKSNNLSNKPLRLIELKRFRVHGNVFQYIVMVEKRESDVASSTNGSRTFSLYKLLDRDGDGKFELLIQGNSDNTVPQWALDRTQSENRR